MRTAALCCALLLSAAPCAAQIGNTDCSQDVMGNWQCRSLKGNFQLYKSPFKPDTWEMVPTPGSRSPRCTIRRDLLGNIQSTCY